MIFFFFFFSMEEGIGRYCRENFLWVPLILFGYSYEYSRAMACFACSCGLFILYFFLLVNYRLGL